ncbi:MAG: protein TolQ [Alphaproteobacteria bacterium]
MKLMRFAAVALTAFVLVVPAAIDASPAYGQIQREQPTRGRPPTAAPSPPGAESQPLDAPRAAPTGAVETELVGPQSEAGEVFSPIATFMNADIIVKGVLILLLAASFWSWVIIIDKWFAYGTLNRKADKFESTFWSGRALDDLYSHYSGRADHPMATMFVAGLREWKRAFEHGNVRETAFAGIKDRVAKAMHVSLQRELDKAERGLGFLATVGSTAPFVGLFGTVWGIMNSFRAIAAQHDTTLAVVAPGIAEALFATALGLLAAVPAVVAYNKFVNEMGRYTSRLEGFADEFSAFLSRQLDERAH